ncbi:hypothetical protein AV530_009038 [Patagioenas fasciata monilis]|uniref:Uncharacterized protein n=1 Tax=Patagioenas fasciata monilis TaxID=372326 RepID=A0A1V4KQU6_PATFA|nr:hypothetical protein AV530_009038 [Patagioenas fasciata monilis]
MLMPAGDRDLVKRGEQKHSQGVPQEIRGIIARILCRHLGSLDTEMLLLKSSKLVAASRLVGHAPSQQSRETRTQSRLGSDAPRRGLRSIQVVGYTAEAFVVLLRTEPPSSDDFNWSSGEGNQKDDYNGVLRVPALPHVRCCLLIRSRAGLLRFRH